MSSGVESGRKDFTTVSYLPSKLADLDYLKDHRTNIPVSSITGACSPPCRGAFKSDVRTLR